MSATCKAPRPPLPARYSGEAWHQAFREAMTPQMQPGVRILDIGSGRRPTIASEDRPARCTYVGLDLYQDEFDRAPAGSYDHAVIGDVVEHRSEFDSSFDLIVSWQVLEHVKPLAGALENIHAYLRPGGRFVGQLSATFSVFGLINQAIPHRAAAWGMRWLLDRDPTSVFPAHYDRCWYSALRKLGSSWTAFSVLPKHAGAGYFAFSPLLSTFYLGYEEWTIRRGHPNLATHYVLVGDK